MWDVLARMGARGNMGIICYTWKNVCLHNWEHGDHRMEWTMGCPNNFDIHNIFPSIDGGSEVAEHYWSGRRMFQESYKRTGSYRVSIWPRTILCRILWEFYLGDKWEDQRGLDRDNPHFYFEFLSIRVWRVLPPTPKCAFSHTNLVIQSPTRYIPHRDLTPWLTS